MKTMKAKSNRCPRWLTALVVTAALSGCQHRGQRPAPGSPQWVGETYESLQRALRKQPNDRELLRSMAYLQWLHRGENAAAINTLQNLAQRHSDRPAHYALMLMAAAREQADAFWQHATFLITSADRPAKWPSDHRWRDAMAEHAAILLEGRLDDRPEDQVDFDQLIAATRGKVLPVEVSRVLLSLQARRARAHGADFRPLYAAQGCVQNFKVSAMIGAFGALDLRQHDPTREPVWSSDQPVQLSCAVRLWNPQPEPGYRRAVTHIEVTQPTVVLHLASDFDLRLFVDGVAIGDDALAFRYVARERRFDLKLTPGLHQIEVALAVPDERAWFLLRLTDGEGRPVATKVPQTWRAGGNPPDVAVQRVDAGANAACESVSQVVKPGISAPLVDFCKLERALYEVDVERGQPSAATLARANTFAEGQWMAARWTSIDPSLDSETRQTRAASLLEPLATSHPELEAALSLALATRWGRGDRVEVARTLQDLGELRLTNLSGWLFRHKVYAANGNEILAERALARAQALHPHSCEVLERRWEEARERDQVERERQITQEMKHCANADERAGLGHAARQEHDQAVVAWQGVIERTPDDLDAWMALALAHRAKGRLREATVAVQKALGWAPFRGSLVTLLADLHLALADVSAAQAVLQQAIALRPADPATRSLAQRVGIGDPLMDERVDGLALIDEYLAAGAPYAGERAVLVLDRDVLWINDDGSARHLVHQIVEVKSKEAIDRYGEAEIPNGARLLTLRTVKRDRTVVDPEVIADKDAISLRELELGDFVEMEFMVPVARGGPTKGSLDGGAFRFQSAQEPYHRSEYIVVHPHGLPVQVEMRNNPPALEKTERNGLLRLHYLARNMPRLELEPNHRAELDVLPAVTVHAKLHPAAQAQTYATSVIDSLNASPTLRQQVARLIGGAQSAAEKTSRIWKFCRDEIEHDAGLDVSADQTLVRRRGNRHVLLMTMLREAGVASQLWLARSRFDTSVRAGGYPHYAAYDTPLVAVMLPGQADPLLFFAGQKWVAPGYLFAGLQGATALRITDKQLTDAQAVVTLPQKSTQPDRRHYTIDATIDERGTGNLRGTIAIEGLEAVQWRAALEELDPEKLNQAFQAAELGQWPQGAGLELIDLQIDHKSSPEKPLQVRFSAKIRELGIFQGGGLSLPVGIVPVNAAAPYASLPERKQDLVINEAPQVDVDLQVHLADATFAALPPAQTIDAPGLGHYQRKVEGKVGGAHVRVRVHASLQAGVFSPTRYQEVSEFAQKVRSAEAELLRVK